MALITVNPTSFTTPSHGGTAVTVAANTGHDATTALENEQKTCKWTGLQAVGGQILGVRLKADWSENGSAPGNNLFTLEYSLNGGAAWLTAFSHSNVTGPNSGAVDIALSAAQDLTQVQVRDDIETAAGGVSVTGTISTIRVEVTTVDTQVVVMM